METKRLYRKSNERVVAGVCAGLGDYFGIDKVIVRLIWVLLVVLGGIGLLAYLISWIMIPLDNAPPNPYK
jgi:phage shock protein PspC (stress-responsive transcriptional regulator)